MQTIQKHYLLLALTTLFAGLAIRFAPLGLPPFVVKYGGSTLWALMIYWLLATLLSLTDTRSVPATAVTTLILTTAIECFKLFHTPALDAFRLTLPGILLLGRFFSPWDLLAYSLAILLGASLDRLLQRSLIS